ncbi:glycosyltransferase family 2 protein [Desulfopila sp. IMCC35006]|uniref:glycosyltransferase family 2 protein n=1 Tax=Desulfopila sp. IMCC35006 TaxID=2569542 RepID=UPI0010AD7675|nr:glycosyltransferase family 2 protein [Desulfopila sp. IMCC35006]TKB24994.1 glycosyltransferase family 2 protein [Desulfopila sp. IMCC35006]
MDLTIITVNWNGEEFISACLQSIMNARQNLKIQVIVVDNASKDNSVALVKRGHPEVELVCSDKNLGFGKACNLGLKKSLGDLVMFLNPDVSVAKNTLSTIVHFFSQHPTVGGVGCKIKGIDGQVHPLMIQQFPSPFLEFIKLFAINSKIMKAIGIHLPQKNPSISGEVVKLSGACFTIRREILIKLNGFDERFFMYCEDGELSKRIVEAGWELYYLAETEVVHNQGACSRKAPKGFSTLMQCNSFEKYIEKEYHRFGALRYRFYMFIGSLLRMSISITAIIFALLLKRNSMQIWERRIAKNWLIFKWSIFLAKPDIPD